MARRTSPQYSDRLSVLETQHLYVQRAVDELVNQTRDLPQLRKSIEELARYAKIAVTIAAGALLHFAGTPLARELGSAIASFAGIPQ